MSRIGKSPITVPSSVNVAVEDRSVTVTGPKGTLSRDLPGAIELRQEDGTLYAERPDDERQNRALHGLTRSLVNNMVVGVTDGFSKKVGQVAADIRAIRKPEPYKGKGVRYAGERVQRKAGKAGK